VDCYSYFLNSVWNSCICDSCDILLHSYYTSGDPRPQCCQFGVVHTGYCSASMIACLRVCVCVYLYILATNSLMAEGGDW